MNLLRTPHCLQMLSPTSHGSPEANDLRSYQATIPTLAIRAPVSLSRPMSVFTSLNVVRATSNFSVSTIVFVSECTCIESSTIGTLPSRTSNTVRWSPRGRHVVLATVGSSSKSELEFWDLDFNSEDATRREGSKDEWSSSIQHLGTADHYAVTDAEWDPSGRYLATSASSWRHTVCFAPLSWLLY